MNYHKIINQISNLHGKRLKIHSFTMCLGLLHFIIPFYIILAITTLTLPTLLL